MTFTSLEDTLDSKPEVLAGPILRKVTPSAVTVWVALRVPASVTLKVWSPQDPRILEGVRPTVAVGRNLHIAAITARLVPGKSPLTEGVVYEYTLDFTVGGSNLKLVTATRTALLAYPPFENPSFALPPADLNQLRLLQGSCRMPHAEGRDAMPMIDQVIGSSAANPYARPHQLLLTGDQIYADDVADTLLPLLSDAGDVLLDWTEVLPYIDAPIEATDLPEAGQRTSILKKAGLTSTDMGSHLMSLGEYLSMYLYVWSDVLWPKPFPNVPKKHADNLAFFLHMLPLVRRALANVPSYMIFDDHEITDDWNTTRSWCAKVYSNPLALRMVQNGLIAYALCQHWGNAPEQFESATPGAGLLSSLDTPNPTRPEAFDRKAIQYNEDSATNRVYLGVHEDTALQQRPENAVYHEDFSLRYDYTIEAPGHQVIVTDTRTWRSFPKGGKGPPVLLPEAQQVRQILQTPQLGDRLLLVVLSTNAPAVGPIRSAARHATLARTFKYHPDVYEAWEIPTIAFDRLLTILTSKLPTVAGGARRGRAILLSGDVHHSYASRLNYRANERYGDPKPGVKATAVIAQLVASSFKKEDADTRGFQREGYTYGPWAGHALDFIPPHAPEGYAGFNVPYGSRRRVGRMAVVGTRFASSFKLELDDPTVGLQSDEQAGARTVTFSESPDYVYRLDYLIPDTDGSVPNAPPIALPGAGATAEQRKQAAQAYRTATAVYRQRGGTPPEMKLIGVNNFGEMTFDWGPGDSKVVHHTLRWRPNESAPVRATTYTVSLDPNHLRDIPHYHGSQAP